MRYFLRYLKTNLTKLLDSLKRMVHLFLLFLLPPFDLVIPYQRAIAADPDHKFDLALSLDNLGTTLQITHTIVEKNQMESIMRSSFNSVEIQFS